QALPRKERADGEGPRVDGGEESALGPRHRELGGPPGRPAATIPARRRQFNLIFGQTGLAGGEEHIAGHGREAGVFRQGDGLPEIPYTHLDFLITTAQAWPPRRFQSPLLVAHEADAIVGGRGERTARTRRAKRSGREGLARPLVLEVLA